MIQTTSDIQAFLPVSKWLRDLNSKSDFSKVEDVAVFGNNLSLLCFYAGELSLTNKIIESLLVFFNQKTLGVDVKISQSLSLQPYINLLRASRLTANDNFDFMLTQLKDLLDGKSLRITIASKQVEISRNNLTNETLSLLKNCIVSELSKIALIQNDFDACFRISKEYPFAEESIVFNEMRVVQHLFQKDYYGASTICLDWMKKASSEEHKHIFYFWLMVIAKENGSGEDAKEGLEKLTNIIRSKQSPTKNQLAILEKIFEIWVKDNEISKAKNIGKTILNAYECKEDELSWAMFVFKNIHLDILDVDRDRLFNCWKETAYRSVYLVGSKFFPEAIDEFVERPSFRELQGQTINFCEFLSKGSLM